mmetsp:Transcript_10309/g.42691  ORF Transcript_10309/g.42691 Transcript_10309/m.42691 type:complete len:269 (-) Transcript_10309:260-1066(-)
MRASFAVDDDSRRRGDDSHALAREKVTGTDADAAMAAMVRAVRGRVAANAWESSVVGEETLRQALIGWGEDAAGKDREWTRRRRRDADGGVGVGGDGAAAAAGTSRTHFVRGRSGRSGRVVRSGRGRSRGRGRGRGRSLRGGTRPIRSTKPRANPGHGTRRARSDADGPLRQLCRPRTMRSSPPTPPRARARSSRSTRASRRRWMRAPPADGAPHLVATMPRGRGIPTAGARRRRRRRRRARAADPRAATPPAMDPARRPAPPGPARA